MEINLASIGIFLIFLGFALVFLSTAKEGKFAVGGIIGIFPFGFGNDPQLVKITIIISAVLVILFIVLMLKGLA